MSEFRRRLLAKKDSRELKENEILAVYNVITTESETRLLGDAFNIASIERMSIDNVSVTPVKTYTFTTVGEHNIKIKIADGITSINSMFDKCITLIDYDLSKLSNSIQQKVYLFRESGIKYIDKFNFIGNLDNAFNGCVLQTIPSDINLSRGFYCRNMFRSIVVAENINKKITIRNKAGVITLLFAYAKIPNVEELEIIGDCGTSINAMMTAANFPKKLVCLETDNVKDFTQICWGNYALRTVNLGSIKNATSLNNIINPSYNDNNIEEFTCREWKKLDLNLKWSPKLKPEYIHYIIENALGVDDGATARTLILHATAKANWGASKYVLNDVIIAKEKNITIDNIETIIIPEGVTTIPDNCFSGLDTLTSIILPNTLTEIGANAFANCGLTTIIIPKNVTYIGDNAFSGCVNVENIFMKPTTAPTLGENVWGDNESNYVGNNVSSIKYISIKGESIGYDTDKWNVLIDLGFNKKEYVYIEYIESNSDAWIDTGVFVNDSNYRIECEFMATKFTANGSIFADYYKDSISITRLLVNDTNKLIVNYKSNNNILTVGNVINNKITSILESNKLIVNDTKYDITSNTNNTNNPTPIILFNRGRDTIIHRDIGARIYWFKVYKDNELILDMIPVRIGNVGYMYDRVNDQFFGNSGTGEFTLGANL